MLDLLTGFVAELRAAGIPVSLTEHLDAAEALRHVPLEDREALKYALGASLVKSSAHWRAFETAFEIYFSLRGPEYRSTATDEGGAGSELDDGRREPAGRPAGPGPGPGRRRRRGGHDPRGAGRAALQGPARSQRRAWSRRWPARRWPATPAWRPGRPVGGTYYLYRTLRNLDLDRVLERLMDEARARPRRSTRTAPGPAAPTVTLTPLEERLLRDEFQARIDRLRQEIEDEIRRRLVADRGSEALAKSLRKPLPEDIDVMHATRDELVALRKALQPAVPQAGRPAGPQAPARPQGAARLPLHRAPLAVHRRGPGRAQVPLPPAVQAGDRGHRRHLGVGGLLRPLHPPPGARHQLPVLQGAQLRLHRRHRRGEPVLRGRSTTRPRPCTGSTPRPT